jgi:hypothetical protein
MAKWKRFELRLSTEQLAGIQQAARARRSSSVSAYIRAVLQEDVRNAISDQENGQLFVAASIDRLSKEVRTLHTAQQALFASLDSLTRLFLTCIPEPPPEALDQAKRRARLRYNKFLLSVAQNMTSDARATMTELMDGN